MNNKLDQVPEEFKQLAKDAQSSGDLVSVENYLQHADHYSRKLSEINSKAQINSKEDMIFAANILLKLGAKNVLIKGGHLKKQNIILKKYKHLRLEHLKL